MPRQGVARFDGDGSKLVITRRVVCVCNRSRETTVDSRLDCVCRCCVLFQSVIKAHCVARRADPCNGWRTVVFCLANCCISALEGRLRNRETAQFQPLYRWNLHPSTIVFHDTYRPRDCSSRFSLLVVCQGCYGFG